MCWQQSELSGSTAEPWSIHHAGNPHSTLPDASARREAGRPRAICGHWLPAEKRTPAKATPDMRSRFGRGYGRGVLNPIGSSTSLPAFLGLVRNFGARHRPQSLSCGSVALRRQSTRCPDGPTLHRSTVAPLRKSVELGVQEVTSFSLGRAVHSVALSLAYFASEADADTATAHPRATKQQPNELGEVICTGCYT